MPHGGIGRGRRAAVRGSQLVHDLREPDRSHYGGVLFNESLGDGAYVIHELHPAVRPVMDARVDVYGSELFIEYRSSMTSREKFDAYLDRYDANLALVYRSGSIARRLARDRDWRLVYESDSRVVFERSAGSHADDR